MLCAHTACDGRFSKAFSGDSATAIAFPDFGKNLRQAAADADWSLNSGRKVLSVVTRGKKPPDAEYSALSGDPLRHTLGAKSSYRGSVYYGSYY